MITGDYPVTALEMARQAGLDTSAGCLTGADIAAMDPDALRQSVERVQAAMSQDWHTARPYLRILEVFDGAASPHQEGVLLQRFFRCGFADDGPILHSPETRFTIPVRQGLGVED